MSLKDRLAQAPASVSVGQRGETALEVGKRLIPEGATVWLVDAADVRSTKQAGLYFCSLSRVRINTVGVFLVRSNGHDSLVVTSIDSSRMSTTTGNAYAQAIKTRFPDVTTPDGQSVAAVASYIKGKPAEVSVKSVADALKEWPALAGKASVPRVDKHAPESAEAMAARIRAEGTPVT